MIVNYKVEKVWPRR